MKNPSMNKTHCPPSMIVDLEAFYCSECNQFLQCDHILSTVYAEYKQQLQESLCNDGYCVIQTAGSSSCLDNTFQVIKAYFSQTIEEKSASVSLDRARRGYSSLSADNFASLVAEVKPNDTVEKFRIGPLVEEMESSALDDEYYRSKEGRVHYFPNTWPDAPAGFQAAISSHYKRMEVIAGQFMHILEVVFALPTGSLCDPLRRHTSIMGMNAYLPIPPPSSSALPCNHYGMVERVAEHTDVSLFTIVTDQCLDDRVSLQMLVAGQWKDIRLTHGQFLVNIGECMQHWSGGILSPARHRVVEMAGSGAVERYSIAYFCSPDYTTSLQWPDGRQGSEQAIDYTTWRKKKIKRTIQCMKQKA